VPFFCAALAKVLVPAIAGHWRGRLLGYAEAAKLGNITSGTFGVDLGALRSAFSSVRRCVGGSRLRWAGVNGVANNVG